MERVIHCVVVTFAMLSVVETTWASDELYRCSDGTFTNRVERKCQPYQSKGIVLVQAGAAEASKQPFAEVKLFTESIKRPGAGR
jgi:hypothetical protein